MLRVLRPGMSATVQDLGRTGLGRFGISPAGAMDALAARAANLLAGNTPETPLLELTGPGALLELGEPRRVGLAGADLGAEMLEGQRSVALAPWRSHAVGTGARLRFPQRRTGARAYLAVAGGIEVARVLGSAATDLASALGGVDGRALRAGDQLALGDDLGDGLGPLDATSLTAWYPEPPRLRVVPMDDPRMDPAARDAFFGGELVVTPQSNRVGYRLRGALPSGSEATGAGISEPLPPGAIQLPPGGEAILLMAERPTTGGYPCVGTVIRADLPRAAQLWPGDRVRFVPVSIDEAHALARVQEAELVRIAGERRPSPAG